MCICNCNSFNYTILEPIPKSCGLRASNMKKAIMDDIRPCVADLQKCKNAVAQGLGIKMKDEEIKPLVEVARLAHIYICIYVSVVR